LYLAFATLWLVGLGVLYIVTIGQTLPGGAPASLTSALAASARARFAMSAIVLTGVVVAGAMVSRFALSAPAPRETRRQLPVALYWCFTLAFGIGSVLLLSAGLPVITDAGDPHVSVEQFRRQKDDVSLALICGAVAVTSAITAVRRGRA
jgi:hypothetical protein